MRTYAIWPPPGVPHDDLQYRNFAGQVVQALQKKGYAYMPATNRPDLAVVVNLEVGEPRTETSVSSMPIFGETGVSSSTTTGTATLFGNVASYNETTTYTPQIGVVDYVPITTSWTECDRVLTVDAYDMRAFWTQGRSSAVKPAWKTTVKSTGTTCNPPEIFPYLLILAEPALGVNLLPQRFHVETPTR